MKYDIISEDASGNTIIKVYTNSENWQSYLRNVKAISDRDILYLDFCTLNKGYFTCIFKGPREDGNFWLSLI